MNGDNIKCTRKVSVQCASATITIRSLVDTESGTCGHAIELTDATGNAGRSLWLDSLDELNAVASAIDTFTDNGESAETAQSAEARVLKQLMRQYRPAHADELPHALLRSSDELIADVADMIDIDQATVAGVMLKLGFKALFRTDGSHGWAMMPTDR